MKCLRWFPKLLALSLLIVLGSGCAFTKTQVKVGFRPTYSQPLQSSSPAPLQLGAFKDSRPVNEPTVLLHKANDFGPTSGAYVTEKPVAELLRDGVLDSLKSNQFKVADTASKYELRGDLQEFGFNSVAGFWKAKVRPRMQVRFELFDKASGTSVWRDTYIGRGELETAIGTSETIVSLFKLGADDIVRQLISDPTFRKLCEGATVTTPAL